MAAAETLDIIGYNGESVPNEFINMGNDAGHLAILFPGLGYTSSLPVLYYPGMMLVDRGADLLQIDYNYMRPELLGSSREEMAARFSADVAAAANAGLARKRYQRVTLIGKSLGTLAMAHLLGSEPRLAGAECIWLTPLITDPALRLPVLRIHPRSIFVIGTDDLHYDPASLADLLDATGGELVAIEGADHSLEIAGDVMGSIGALRTMMLAIAGFLDRGTAARPLYDETCNHGAM